MDFLTHSNVALAIIIICLAGIWQRSASIARSVLAIAKLQAAQFDIPTDVRIVGLGIHRNDQDCLRVIVRTPESEEDLDPYFD
jgi:hypothetical protein